MKNENHGCGSHIYRGTELEGKKKKKKERHGNGAVGISKRNTKKNE
jgi:hypothetical protein